MRTRNHERLGETLKIMQAINSKESSKFNIYCQHSARTFDEYTS
ncbi:hypothetical protein C5167_015650 [Papaver somniferum]|uniref:Uncharacterized protein n=1 Tax=Papaver somniferum TaxID=3469 RepID=A0A4Y7J6P9_PAPSO|nr:hypothetical protein C5167_015650 [Papaver somniferum]